MVPFWIFLWQIRVFSDESHLLQGRATLHTYSFFTLVEFVHNLSGQKFPTAVRSLMCTRPQDMAPRGLGFFVFFYLFRRRLPYSTAVRLSSLVMICVWLRGSFAAQERLSLQIFEKKKISR